MSPPPPPRRFIVGARALFIRAARRRKLTRLHVLSVARKRGRLTSECDARRFNLRPVLVINILISGAHATRDVIVRSPPPRAPMRSWPFDRVKFHRYAHNLAVERI